MGDSMQKFKQWLEHYGPVVARVLLAQVFIVSGIGKIKAFVFMGMLISNLGIPTPQLMLILTIAFEVGGGLLLIAGWQARYIALLFFGFTFLTAVLVHPFWVVEQANMGGHLNNFMKNLSIMGGMLYVVIHGPGPLSLGRDNWQTDSSQGKKKK